VTAQTLDTARSTDPALDAALARVHALFTGQIDLSLDRLHRLLVQLGSPHLALPPVFHIAGTNGKGSTVAYLRACLEASGRRVHTYTSPHLVRFNERIRLAGTLIEDAPLTALIDEVLAVNGPQPITFFEFTTAAALLAYARTPADVVILEVGMGGRLDPTNVIPEPAMTGIAQLGLDHTQWLGPTILDIAREKAGIAKPGVPMVHARYPRTVAARVAEVAGVAGARLHPRGTDWDAAAYQDHLHYRDVHGLVTLPLPRLAGAHQLDNAALAIAMLRHQSAIHVPEAALRAGLGWAEWPARLQRLDTTPLGQRLPPGSQIWLDGGHNPAAARAVAETFKGHDLTERPFHLITGMLPTKDGEAFFKAFTSRVTAAWTVPIPDSTHHDPLALARWARAAGLRAAACASVPAALQAIAAEIGPAPVVLIAGSLHLAGAVLAEAGLRPT